eukprot:132205-Rhodomonas_salina.2
MVPTLSRPENLITMPAHALVVVDEAHHAAAETCSNIVRAAQTLNPDVRLLGVTATPVRGDKKPLAEWYSNAFTINLFGPRAQDEQRGGVEKRVLNHPPVNRNVVLQWKERAGGRQTVVLCTNIEHASAMQAAFLAQGIAAELAAGGRRDGAAGARGGAGEVQERGAAGGGD